MLIAHSGCQQGCALQLKLTVLQVTTEGDAFVVAFHDPIDAVGWALHVQLALLEAPWPPEVLQHPQARVDVCPEGKLLFRGLRVRMAINTGVPAEIIVRALLAAPERFLPCVVVTFSVVDAVSVVQQVLLCNVCSQMP